MAKINPLDILNKARVEAGYEDRIPEITQDNLHSLSLLAPEELNDFLHVIVKVVKQYVYDTTFDVSDNPFASFFSEKVPVGYSVEDMYVDLITGTTPAWNDDGSYALSKKVPDVTTIYHSENYEMQYKVSDSYPQMQTAFLTMGALDSLINKIKGTLNSSAQYDLFLQTLNLISTAITRSAFKIEGGYSIDDEAGIKKLLKRMKTLAKDFKFMGTKYNYFGFNTKTPPEDIVIITKPSVLETINVDYLAGVFNLSNAEINERIIEVPDDYGFGALDNPDSAIHPIMIIMDKRMLRIFPTFFEGSSIFNPASFVYNTFLTLKYIFSYSLFFNGVVLCSDEDGLTLNIDSEEGNISVEVNGKNVYVGDEGQLEVEIANGDIVEVTNTRDVAISIRIIGLYDGIKNEILDKRVDVEAGDTFKFKVYNNNTTSTAITVSTIL